MILCVGTTPAVQRVMLFERLALNEVNRAAATYDGAAGKSINVAKVLKSLGERPVATGLLGGDRGEQIAAWLQAKAIEMAFIRVSTPTRQCITVIDQTAGTQTELVEESQPVPLDSYTQLLASIATQIKQCRAAVMSGTITPGGPADFYARCAQLAREAGALAIVDGKGPLLEQALQARPAVVKPNRAELGATVKRELLDQRAVMAAMREIAERGAERVVVTAGAAPTLAFDGKKLWEIQSPRVECVNPIGSGDAFTAGLVWRLVRGEDLGQACKWASAAGAANTLSAMPGEVDSRDVHRLVDEVSVQPVQLI